MTIQDKQTEEKIFDAATEVFEEQGMAGARMQHIADRAGINKALLHYYFRTKDQLFDAVFAKLAQKMFMKFAPVFSKEMSLENKIRFFFREHINFLQQNPKLPGFILNEINHNPQRVKKILKNIDIRSLWKEILELHKEELDKYNITEENIPQILSTIISLSVFPFAAKGIFEVVLDNAGFNFNEYTEDRKEFAAEFIIKALKKEEVLKVPKVKSS
jgi:TetR/AcrR family transcriptional regulator